jgi:cation diffusion facilitator family transporter
MPENHTSKKFQDESSRQLHDLRLVVYWGVGTLIPLTVLFIAIGIISDSLTIFAVAFDYGLSVIVNIFAFVAIRIMLKKNIFTFPYGVGKLENFTSLLYGTLLMPTGCFLIYSAIIRFINPPDNILFGVSQIPMGISLIRSLGLLMFTSWIIRRNRQQTSLMSSYEINYKISAVMDVSVITALGAAFILISIDMHGLALMIDPTVTILLAVYMLINGSRLIVKNFKSLIDLPLPEDDQMKILQVLTSEYDNFENIGLVYTRRSGNTRFIELELFFGSHMTLSDIAGIERRLKEGLSAYFPDLTFRLMPMTSVMAMPTSR